MTVATGYADDHLDDDGGASRARPDDDVVGRVVWAPATAGGALDGAWWPHTRNAAVEFAALIPLVAEHLGGPVRRVSGNIEAWDPEQPRRLRIGDGLVRVGWFHTIDPATVTLGRGGEARVTLLVVPPDLEPAAAAGLLRQLSAAGDWPESATSALNGAWALGGSQGGT
jgi:hypothetical protein